MPACLSARRSAITVAAKSRIVFRLRVNVGERGKYDLTSCFHKEKFEYNAILFFRILPQRKHESHHERFCDVVKRLLKRLLATQRRRNATKRDLGERVHRERRKQLLHVDRLADALVLERFDVARMRQNHSRRLSHEAFLEQVRRRLTLRFPNFAVGREDAVA